MTLGRHLDNEVLLAGEDVLDYHLRIETTHRGPRAIPLAESSLWVNGEEHGEPVGLMPGDVVEIGQNTLEVAVELRHPAEAESWALSPSRPGDAPGGVSVHEGCLIDGSLGIGRGDDSDLQLLDDHVSRRHARLEVQHGVVWLRDLGSSNGSFVNGERIRGACRLFHGDEIRFDAIAFQLVGRGGELTPVRPLAEAPRPLSMKAALRSTASASADTTELAAVEEALLVEPRLPGDGETGAFLLGASEPVAGLTFRTPMGRTLVGRDETCDLVIRDRTVSARHAELTVRAEGVTVTNLMATNGTRVNGQEVQTARLHDGDVLRFGRVSLVYKDVPPAEEDRPWLRHVQVALLVGSLVLGVGVVMLLI